jgi:hypothetical protein
MGLVLLAVGLLELIGVVYGAPHWGWIAVAIWFGCGGSLVGLATLQLHRRPVARIPV